MLEQKKTGGISLRTIHIGLIIGAVIISCTIFYSTYRLSASFRNLARTSQEQEELRNAAHELMDASDYLTENVQRFTVDGDMQFLNAYFTEAFQTNRREEAIDKLSETGDADAALEKLQKAMDGSLGLMEREYYAMKLVIEAKDYKDYPEILDSVELSKEDAALSASKKMRLANKMVLDDEYYRQKNNIRENMQASVSEIEKLADTKDASALTDLKNEVTLVRVVIILQTILIILMVWMTSRLGINPILDAVDNIKGDSPIPENGANEFRYLARTYNKMYEVYKSSLEQLNFKASHDELTGAYNRSGYELLLSTIDLNSVYLMLFDVDDFKNVNDTYGHDTGDRVLMKVVEVLKSHFRSEDYVCRIGGDEFVVFMMHAEGRRDTLVASKIQDINRALSQVEDGLPAVSVSVGVVHGTDAANADVQTLYEKADDAMYRAKKDGKHTFKFYNISKNSL